MFVSCRWMKVDTYMFVSCYWMRVDMYMFVSYCWMTVDMYIFVSCLIKMISVEQGLHELLASCGVEALKSQGVLGLWISVW